MLSFALRACLCLHSILSVVCFQSSLDPEEHSTLALQVGACPDESAVDDQSYVHAEVHAQRLRSRQHPGTGQSPAEVVISELLSRQRTTRPTPPTLSTIKCAASIPTVIDRLRAISF